MQRLDTLSLLALGKTVCRRHLEEGRGSLHEPFRLDRCRALHVFFGRQDQGVVDDMFRWLAEQGGTGMHVDRCAFDKGLVSFRGIFTSRVSEESRTQRLAYFGRVSPTGDNPMVISIHDTQELLANILGSADLSGLNKVFVTPGIVELGILPLRHLL